jgi:hypothetical protein
MVKLVVLVAVAVEEMQMELRKLVEQEMKVLILQ